MADISYSHLESESAIQGRSTVDLGPNYGRNRQLSQVEEVLPTTELSEDDDREEDERISCVPELKIFPSSIPVLREQSSEGNFSSPSKPVWSRRASAPVIPNSEEILYTGPEFLLGKQYPSASKFGKKIRSNPEMDLVLCRKVSQASSISSQRSLQLTQLQYSIYISNVEDILKKVLHDDTVVSLIMEYFQNAKCVSFNSDPSKYYIVDPVGSEHRMSSPAYHLMQRPASLEIWNRKPKFSPAEKEEAKETAASMDFQVDFPDAYQ